MQEWASIHCTEHNFKSASSRGEYTGLRNPVSRSGQQDLQFHNPRPAPLARYDSRSAAVLQWWIFLPIRRLSVYGLWRWVNSSRHWTMLGWSYGANERLEDSFGIDILYELFWGTDFSFRAFSHCPRERTCGDVRDHCINLFGSVDQKITCRFWLRILPIQFNPRLQKRSGQASRSTAGSGITE